MRPVHECLTTLVRAYKQAAALEVYEAALSTNKPWVSAQGGRTGKRGPSGHIPIEGRHPESIKSFLSRCLNNFTDFVIASIAAAEDGLEVGSLPKRAHPGWEARRQAVLGEIDVSPVAVAFVYGYSSDKSVRELRIRNGKDEHTGRPLRDAQRPIISIPRRVRK